LNEDFTAVVSSVTVQVLTNDRAILGLAFDPMDTSPNPTVYCTSSKLFHGEWRDTFGNAINGKILAISGANLDIVTEVITGLPVSEADHAVSLKDSSRQGAFFANRPLLHVAVEWHHVW
jgi:hypothetical protein